MTITLSPTFLYVTGLNALSIIFFIISLKKLRRVLKFLALEESSYTLLFGYIGVRTYMYMYALSILVFAVLLWLITI